MRDETLGDRAVGLATAAALDLGLNPAGAAIHRHIVSVHVELPAEGVMARVEARDRLAIAHRQVQVARFLESLKLPAARLVLPDRQPLIYGDGVVTLWEAVVILERRPDAAILGQLARRLHEATAGILPAEIPDIDPLSLVRGWLPRLGTEPMGEEVGKLWDELEWLERLWGETIAGDPLGTVLVHGDFHHDNVVVTPEGPTLLDLEEAGRGPASWDLVPRLRAAADHLGYRAPAYLTGDGRRGRDAPVQLSRYNGRAMESAVEDRTQDETGGALWSTSK